MEFDYSTCIIFAYHSDSDITVENWFKHKIVCDCPFFMKNFICKHSIGIAVTMKLVQIPSDAKYDLNPIGCLPKRGRPPKAKRGQALCRFTD